MNKDSKETQSIITHSEKELQHVEKGKVPEFRNLWAWAQALNRAGMFPQFKNPFQVLTAIELGRELGSQPVQSLMRIFPVQGNMGIKSEFLVALAIQGGIKYKIIKKDKKGCTIEFKRAGFDTHNESFTEEDAKRIKDKSGKALIEKDNYKNYPEEMYMWRCFAKGLRAYAPDIIGGVYTIEEIHDFAEPEVNKNETPPQEIKGEVIDVGDDNQEEQEEQEKEIKEIEEQENDIQIEESPETDKTDNKDKVIDKELEDCIFGINSAIELAGVDRQEFLSYLDKFGKKKGRKFVGKKYGNYSLHAGNKEHIKELIKKPDAFSAIMNMFVQKKLKEKKKA